MKIVKHIFMFFLFTAMLSLSHGCATLPIVSEKIDEAPIGQKARPIVSSKGYLSPQKSKAIMERLKRQVNPTDVLERYIAVVESATESPLTKGNKVTLLKDGTATYAAMFQIIRNAKDHINLETFILEDDEIGRIFTDLLLEKQAEGVEQINASIEEINKSAQANAASSEQAASVAQQTTAQSVFMKSIVEKLTAVVGYRS